MRWKSEIAVGFGLKMKHSAEILERKALEPAIAAHMTRKMLSDNGVRARQQ